MQWIKKALSEPDGTPSSQRLMLMILLVFTLNMLSCGFYQAGGLPVVPESLSNFIQWLFTAVMGGYTVGKVGEVVRAIKQPTTIDPPTGV